MADATHRSGSPNPIAKSAATRVRVAAIFLFVISAAVASPGLTQDLNTPTLASELLIAQGDLDRLGDPELPAPHRMGLAKRLTGSLGLLPWLLERAGDTSGAAAVTTWQGENLAAPDHTSSLASLLISLSERHPLETIDLEARLTATSVRESRAIHETYCAGCHDGTGNGDPDIDLPARDLFLMGREDAPMVFLARLINGIKGDETLGFRNPMTDEQMSALWIYYRTD